MNTDTPATMPSVGITERCVKSVCSFVDVENCPLNRGLIEERLSCNWYVRSLYSFTVVTNPRIFHRTHDASPKTLNALIFNRSIVYSPIKLDLLHSKVSCLQAVTVTTLVFSLFSFLFLFFSVLIILTKFTLEGLRSDRTETTLDPYKTPQGKL